MRQQCHSVVYIDRYTVPVSVGRFIFITIILLDPLLNPHSEPDYGLSTRAL
jgi:hypothetical protein